MSLGFSMEQLYTLDTSRSPAAFKRCSSDKLVGTDSSSTSSVGKSENVQEMITPFAFPLLAASFLSMDLPLKKQSSASSIEDFPASLRPTIVVISSKSTVMWVL